MVKPAEMTKISVTGPKRQLRGVIDTLYELELLDIEAYEGEEFETGNPFEEAEELSETLVDVRSILSKIPEVGSETESILGSNLGDVLENIEDIREDVEGLEKDLEDSKSKIEDLNRKKEFFEMLTGTGLKYEDLKGTESLDVFIGRIDAEEFRSQAEFNYELVEAENAEVVFYQKKDSETAEDLIGDLADERFEVLETSYSGTMSDLVKKIDSDIDRLQEDKVKFDSRMNDLAEEWRVKLENAERFLTEKIVKSEAPINFATTDRAFIAEGWVPADSLEDLKTRLEIESDGLIHIEEEEGGNPPVKQQNNRVVTPFEGLTRLVDVPKYNEVDPSFMLLLTFPLFFGMMIGDIGYGITTAIVFFAGMKMFTEVSDIFKALIWTSAATALFGIIYGEMFGFQIYESPFYRADYWTEIFYIAIGIGVVHVNLGFLIGAYNEYLHHGIVEAIFAKISWIFLQVAVLASFIMYTFYGSVPGIVTGLGIAVPSLFMLYKGEGIEGLVELPGLVSNILSYLRLFGVCMAAYTLAGTANAIATPAFASGTLLGVAGGVITLIVAHTILTFIKIMEGFIQGIRLHYVEMFGWFFEGGGRKYDPFGNT